MRPLQPDRLFRIALLSLVSTCLHAQGPGSVPAQAELDSLNRLRLNTMEFRRFDKDSDGMVSRTEYENLTGSMKRVHREDPAKDTGNGFSLLDLDGDHALSPHFLVDRSDRPLLTMLGDRDHTQHISHTENMAAHAKEKGADVDLVVVKNAGHNWRQVGEPIEPSKKRIKQIMLEYALKKVKTDPDPCAKTNEIRE